MSRAIHRARHRAKHDVFGGEYSVVDLRLSWGWLSIACFLLALPSRYWVRMLPWKPEFTWVYPWWVVVAMGLLSVAGTVFGVLGWRQSRGRPAAKVGLVANGLVLLLVGLTYVGMRWIAGR